MMERVLTVAALTEKIKTCLEDTFDPVWVEGEISNLRRPASGHIYFTLKDDRAQIRAVWFKPFPGSARERAFDMEEGLAVICRGRISVYTPRGDYQLLVGAVEPKGLGALQKAFEQLKSRLEAEGLFAETHKKKIPFLPSCIGIITSPTGSVIRDILHVTKRRFPSIPLLIAPVRVQGSEAPPEIVRAIENMTTVGKADVLILARGGGSLEDLAPFNDEQVARAIFACPIPIISAVGHETDYTIADFTADLRAPTPSAAAELAVPHREDLKAALHSLRHRLVQNLVRRKGEIDQQWNLLQERLRNPRRHIDDFRLTLDDCQERLKTRLRLHLRNQATHIAHLEVRLTQASPGERSRQSRFILESYLKSMIAAIEQRVDSSRQILQKDMALLESFSPLAVLNRGYSITFRSATNEVIRDVRCVHDGEEVTIRLAKGRLTAAVKGREDPG